MGRTALLIIDMQMAMAERIAAGRAAVNPEAGAAIARLAAACRAKGVAVVHVRHHEADPASPFHPDVASARPMPCDVALPGEAVFIKHTSSAFASTDLAAHLRDAGGGAVDRDRGGVGLLRHLHGARGGGPRV